MGMGSRFRRVAGVFGAMAMIAGIFGGAALAIGQSAASAGTSSAWSVDLGGPNVLLQNAIGYQDTPVVGGVENAGNGWSFVVAGWVTGDQIVLTVGTPNGGAGVECNTVNPYGVNQSVADLSNYVLFNGEDTGGTTTTESPVIEATGGIEAPVIDTSLGAVASAPDAGGDNYGDGDCGSGTNTGPNILADPTDAQSYQLVLTFENSSGPLGTSDPLVQEEVFLGFGVAAGDSTPSQEPIVFTTGFGTATGTVPFSAVYETNTNGPPFSVGSSNAGTDTGPTPVAVTVPSDSLVIGETPSGNSPASGIVRTTGVETVPSTAISNFVINDFGGFLPPFDAAEVGGIGPEVQTENTESPSEPLVGTGPGYVCLALDNNTGQNLEFTTTPTWSVTPGADTAGFSASAGVPTVTGALSQILSLPVTGASNAAAVWTASGIQLATIPSYVTEADGPVWAAVYYAYDGATCVDGAGIENTGPAFSVRELGYVQLTTVSELANSIFGATAVDTAAEAIGHQFDYATGQCIGGTHFPFGGPIFVATDADYHDALGASYPAGADDSAVALTDPGTLSSATANIIREEGVQTVYLVGGVDAISANVENTLASTPSYVCGGVDPRYNILGQPEDLTVIRIAGAVADDTNELLATFPGAEPITPTPGPFGAYANPSLFNDTGSGNSTPAPTVAIQNTALLVTDAGFQDAVSGSALAYDWPMPLITTTPDALSTDALNAISNDHITQVIVLGGTDAVSDTVISNLQSYGISALRIAGLDGSDTSTQLAAFELAAAPPAITVPPSPADGLGLNNEDFLWQNFVNRTAGEIFGPDDDGVAAHAVLLARGDFYSDAETASVLAVHNGFYADFTPFKPIILTENPSTLGSAVTTFLNEAGLAVSGLAGELPAGGWDDSGTAAQSNESSSSVYTIQPIGGVDALTTATLSAAIAAVTAG
jgi:putative cell wall-binding protein